MRSNAILMVASAVAVKTRRDAQELDFASLRFLPGSDGPVPIRNFRLPGIRA